RPWERWQQGSHQARDVRRRRALLEQPSRRREERTCRPFDAWRTPEPAGDRRSSPYSQTKRSISVTGIPNENNNPLASCLTLSSCYTVNLLSSSLLTGWLVCHLLARPSLPKGSLRLAHSNISTKAIW